MPTGSGLRTAGPPTLGSPWREPAGRITNSEANAVSYCTFWSSSPNNFAWSRISRDPPPMPPSWGCLKGRDEEGFSWDSTELGEVGLVTPAADAPTDIPSPEIMLLLGYLEGWTSRKAEHMRERGMKTVIWVLVEHAPYYSSLGHLISFGHISPSLQILPLCLPSEATSAYFLLMFVFFFALFKHILCSYYSQMLWSLFLPNSCPTTQGKKSLHHHPVLSGSCPLKYISLHDTQTPARL